ncbi:translation initiation factor IF-3, partial [Treponema pallidum]
KINDHDMAFKAKHIQRFLDEGDKVKVTIRFRGRELAHTDLGFNVLQNVLGRLVCGYSVEKQAAMEGRSMSMTLTPKSKK